jgi:dihydrofolate synthase/folylpolyglutamate synthase
VIDARVSVLTNVGLEHTRWLGPTVGDIAAEKLAALSEGATLVLGADPQATVLELARKLAGERSARLLVAGAGGAGGAGGAEIDGEAGSAPPLQARGDFQRRNFELATLAARCCLKEMGHPFSAEAVRAAAAATVVPGRLDVLEREPLVVLDGAHNPHALDALMRSLAPMLGSRALGAVFGVLDDKDAARMLAGLLGRCERVWFTVPPSSRALSPATLESLARQHGFAGAFAGCEPQPARAFEAAVSWASQRPRERAVLGTGSIYLVGELMRAGRALRAGAPAATAGGDGR